MPASRIPSLRPQPPTSPNARICCLKAVLVLGPQYSEKPPKPAKSPTRNQLASLCIQDTECAVFATSGFPQKRVIYSFAIRYKLDTFRAGVGLMLVIRSALSLLLSKRDCSTNRQFAAL